MKRAALVLGACLALLACSGDPYQDHSHPVSPSTPSTPPPPPATFVLFGTVRDMDENPLAGATAEVVTGRSANLTAISNANGYFSFTGVAGDVTLRVYKEGYDRFLKTFTVAADMAINVDLPRVELADTISLGHTIQSSVGPDAPPCDPVRWDARAPCRTFLIPRSTSGLLVVTITWSGDPELDATLVDSREQYVATSVDAPGDELSLSAWLEAGKTYVLRVNSYYARQIFLLKAEFQAAQGSLTPDH